MPQKPLKPIKRKQPKLEPWKVKYLLTGKKPDAETIKKEKISKLAAWELCYKTYGEDAWKDHKKWILKDFIRENPGRRPWAWWKYDAPRWSRKFDAWFDGELPEPRQRIGGTGTPDYEALGSVPWFSFGVPRSYVDKWSEDYYNGRMEQKDPFMAARYTYKEGDFDGIGLDLDDPPTFEAEATYLKRHNLLSKSEEKRLKSGDFEPESCINYIKTY